MEQLFISKIIKLTQIADGKNSFYDYATQMTWQKSMTDRRLVHATRFSLKVPEKSDRWN